MSLIYNKYTHSYVNKRSAKEGIFRAYLHIKPPLSHFLRESVFSGKSSSGRCSTSTRTDNSAWTSGRRRSSRADTMSYSTDKETSLLLEWFTVAHIKSAHTRTNTVPAAFQWCFCSPVKRSPWSLGGQHCELKVSSSWPSSEQCCWISRTGCAPGCPGPRGWLLLCLWLSGVTQWKTEEQWG